MKLIEQQTHEGVYGLPHTVAIVEHPEQGRVLIAEGFGGMDDLSGGNYRWRHGVACQLQVTDTLDALDQARNECCTIIEAALSGHDPDRPLLNWSGDEITEVARAAGLD